MRSLVNLLVLAAVATAAVSCGHRMQLVNSNSLAKAGLQYYWQFPVGLEKGESINILYKIDENLYCVTDYDRLICVDAASGVSKWTYVIETHGERIYHPSHADKAVISPKAPGIADILDPDKGAAKVTFKPVVINTSSHVLVLDRDTGELMRDIKLNFIASTGTACDGVHVYVGSTKGNYYSIFLQEAVICWTMSTNSMLMSPPAVSGNHVFIGGTDDTVRAVLNSREPRKVWDRPLGGPVDAPLTVTEKACLAPCDNGRLYAFQPATGFEMWKQPFITRGQLRQPAQLGPNTVFQFARGDKFYAINLVSGLKRWESDSALAVLALMNNNVYMLDRNNNLQIADEVLGAVKQSVPLTGFDLYVANTTSPAIYVGSHDGRLACIRPVAAGYIKPKDLPAGANR